MELKNLIHLSVVKNERTYELILPVNAPYGEAYDATFEFLKHISELAKQAAEQAARAEQE